MKGEDESSSALVNVETGESVFGLPPSAWHPGQPNGEELQRCVSFEKGDGTMWDDDCDSKRVHREKSQLFFFKRNIFFLRQLFFCVHF